MSEKKDERSGVITGNFEVAWQISDRRSVKMMGYVFAEDAAIDINNRIDMMQEAIERQAVRSDIINKEAEKQRVIQSLELHAEHLAELSDKRKRGDKLVTQEKALLDKSDADVRNAKRQIASLDAAIRAGKTKLNGAASA